MLPLVLCDHLLDVPGLPAGAASYNPGMARWAGRDVVALRVEKRTPGQKDADNVVAMATLDSNRQVDGPVSILELPQAQGPVHTTEDPRLIVHQGHLYLVYNMAMTQRVMGPRTLQLVRLDVDTSVRPWTYRPAIAKSLLYVGPGGQLPYISKNWSPFVADGRLHFIFSSSPLQVVVVNNSDLAGPEPMLWCEALPADPTPVPWRYGPPRGGTQAVYEPLLRRFVTFFHSSRRCRTRDNLEAKQYFVGAYTFTPEAPFVVDQMLPHPLLTPAALAEVEEGGSVITFPAGLMIDDDALHLSYGHNDREAGLMTLDKWRLYSQLVPAR